MPVVGQKLTMLAAQPILAGFLQMGLAGPRVLIDVGGQDAK